MYLLWFHNIKSRVIIRTGHAMSSLQDWTAAGSRSILTDKQAIFKPITSKHTALIYCVQNISMCSLMIEDSSFNLYHYI